MRDVDRAVADHAVGDVHVAAARVADLRALHRRILRLRPPPGKSKAAQRSVPRPVPRPIRRLRPLPGRGDLPYAGIVPKGKSNSTFFKLSKGAFTFVAGNVAKTGDMKIDTPVATMGIRGTTPHVEVSDDGTTRFSTLIEEGKNKLNKLKKKAEAPTAQPEQKFNPKICRGC